MSEYYPEMPKDLHNDQSEAVERAAVAIWKEYNGSFGLSRYKWEQINDKDRDHYRTLARAALNAAGPVPDPLKPSDVNLTPEALAKVREALAQAMMENTAKILCPLCWEEINYPDEKKYKMGSREFWVAMHNRMQATAATPEYETRSGFDAGYAAGMRACGMELQSILAHNVIKDDTPANTAAKLLYGVMSRWLGR